MRYIIEIYRYLVQYYYQFFLIIWLILDMLDYNDFDFLNIVFGLNIGYYIFGFQVIEERRIYEFFKEGLDYFL